MSIINLMKGGFGKDKFKSKGNELGTPHEFFERLDDEFHFTLDPCASPSNHKCENYFTEEVNGLEQDWSNDVVWMNPPFGNNLKDWVKKAYNEAQNGAVVVSLIPVRSNTNWWHSYCMKAKEIRLIRGRIKFIANNGEPYSHGLPYPLALVIFQQGDHSPIFTSYDSSKQSIINPEEDKNL